MAKVFIYLGYSIYIYSDDHLPVHVHVIKQGRESKFELRYNSGELTVICAKIKGKAPLKDDETAEIKRFINKYHLKIKDQWDTIHFFKKKAEIIIIRKHV